MQVVDVAVLYLLHVRYRPCTTVLLLYSIQDVHAVEKVESRHVIFSSYLKRMCGCEVLADSSCHAKCGRS
jgi:hypothetical protein